MGCAKGGCWMQDIQDQLFTNFVSINCIVEVHHVNYFLHGVLFGCNNACDTQQRWLGRHSCGGREPSAWCDMLALNYIWGSIMAACHWAGEGNQLLTNVFYVYQLGVALGAAISGSGAGRIVFRYRLTLRANIRASLIAFRVPLRQNPPVLNCRC